MATQPACGDGEKPTKKLAVDVHEGDRVLLGINWHGSATDGFYHRGLFQSVVEGEVIDAPEPESAEREMLSAGERPMIDFAVETDDGEVYRWNVDNGYVLGFHEGLGRRSDVGKFGGFYEA